MSDPAPLVDGLNARTYEIETKGGTFRVTVPSSYRITYGPVIGVSSKSTFDTGMSLRIWETKDLQRGLWLNVISFRDLSLPMTVKAVRAFGSQDWRVDDGNYPPGTVEHGWKSPDELKTESEPIETEKEDDDEPHPYATKLFGSTGSTARGVAFKAGR